MYNETNEKIHKYYSKSSELDGALTFSYEYNACFIRIEWCFFELLATTFRALINSLAMSEKNLNNRIMRYFNDMGLVWI